MTFSADAFSSGQFADLAGEFVKVGPDLVAALLENEGQGLFVSGGFGNFFRSGTDDFDQVTVL